MVPVKVGCMIVKEYYQNINIHKPRDYFENWYADLWNRRIGSRTAQPGIVDSLMKEELALVNATVADKDRGYRFVVTFHNDTDYTMFALRWS